MDTPLDTPAATLPQVKITPGVYVVVYDTEDGIRLEEFPFKREVLKFLGTIDRSKILVVYQGAKAIELQTKITF
jgi:hypothetical protein